VLIRADRDLLDAIPGAHPRARHGNAPAPERDLPVIAPVPIRDPIRIMPALRATHLFDLLGHQLLQHPEPDTNAQREQPLLRCPNKLPKCLLNPRRKQPLDGVLRVDDLRSRYGLHAVLLSSRRSVNSGETGLEIALHAANRSGRGRENRHLKFYARRDNLPGSDEALQRSTSHQRGPVWTTLLRASLIANSSWHVRRS
jgi:hypothetical protein